MKYVMRMIRTLPFSWISKKLLFLFVLLPLPIFAQIGIAAYGGGYYPGMAQSDENNISLKLGGEYGFFLRHDVWSSEKLAWNLRYSTTFSKHQASVKNFSDARYELSSFGIDIFVEWKNSFPIRVYGGAGIGLLSAVGKYKFQNDFVEETIHPLFFAGARYGWAEGFDAFAELQFRIATSAAGPEEVPLHGPGLKIGITMFLSEPE